MGKRAKFGFIVLWIACSILAVCAAGLGRVRDGLPFFAQYDTTLQNAFYMVGFITFGVVLGWLLAKLIQGLARKLGS